MKFINVHDYIAEKGFYFYHILFKGKILLIIFLLSFGISLLFPLLFDKCSNVLFIIFDELSDILNALFDLAHYFFVLFYLFAI
jgi:hypothetical protein